MGRTSAARERIVNSATRLIHARGYNHVSVKDICLEAGVLKGSFYHFFPAKRALVLAVLDAQWEIMSAAVLEPAFADDVPPLDRIRRFFFLTRDFQDQHRDENGHVQGCPFGNLAAELSGQEKQVREKLEGIYERMCGYLLTALDELWPNVDSLARARTLLAYHQGAVLLAKTSNDPELLASFADGALQLASAN